MVRICEADDVSGVEGTEVATATCSGSLIIRIVGFISVVSSKIVCSTAS